MNEREALNKTIKLFNLKAVDIAERANIPESDLSKFRNGKNDILAERFFKIAGALPRDARSYLFMLLASSDDIEGVKPLVTAS
jgi:predicted transcriptional regulator